MFIFFVTSTSSSRKACHHKPDERPPLINLLGGDCNQLAIHPRTTKQSKHTVNLASLDVVRDVLGAAAVNTATDRESGTEDLKDGTTELLGQRTVAHDAGDLDDVVERDRLGVLDVLLLLTVTRGLLEGLDDQRGSGGHNGDGGLTVLDGETDGHTETLL